MLKLKGYEILNQIYESSNTLVYRGIRVEDRQAVILKVLKQDYPTPAELTRYKQEYEIARNLNVDGAIAAYSLEPLQRTLVIILEDFGGSSLKQLIDLGKMALPLPEFLNIAIKISESLGNIHSANVIHKDINPANIIYNPVSGIVKIIDFGISTVLNRENPTLKNPNVLEGTLAYMSPEQTGRMNRSLDYRTDFYSLGVTFYELLTGELPFKANDALELVHCHIAKQPVAPHYILPEIPEVISDIVMKMMAKTAEERYQSAFGIKADLEKCLAQLQDTGNIYYFAIATKDISDKFQIPQKLYGRETEVETLLAAFERVANNPQSKTELMLVAGYSGIGKSSLVAEIHKPNTRLRGYFTSGKFDQFQRNVPYSAIVNAFKGLVRQLLTESEAQLNQWQAKLLAAFGSNGQVIIDVIPEVELIIGKQPPVPELGPSEAQNRFNLVFQKFIRVFCTQEHPLVIFLDDLQWADSATLKLIELMMTDTEMQYLFLIGAYRDNEVSPTHPLMMTVDGLHKAGATINFISLSPLKIEHINQLIADTLHSNTDNSQPLAELVISKTGGNPFFVNQFLKTLHAENLITFDFDRIGWQWNMAEIEAQDITDNVVDLMIGKLKKLPKSTQQILRLASCVGADFDLNTLSIVCEKSQEAISPDLVTAVQSGLILPLSELDEKLLIQDYKFGHDRIQQAAYALIDDDRKKAVHLQIGRLLLANVSAVELSEKLFEIVDHLNLGRELIADKSERIELAKLNFEAGKKAKDSTAYAAAFGYLTAGMELADNGWQECYDLMLALHNEALEAANLSGNYDQMNVLVEVVLQQAKTLLDKMKVYQVQIQASVSQGNTKAAIKIGLAVLKFLGLILPEEPSQLDIQAGLQETASLSARQEIEDLINLPEMTDPEQLAAMDMLASIISATYVAAPQLFVLVVLSKVNLSIKYGNTSVSPFGYVTYGILLCGVLGELDLGYRFGQLALNLVSKLNAKKISARTSFVVSGFIRHWREHIRESVKPLQSAYSIGVETGDLEYAGLALYLSFVHAYFSGKELTKLEPEIVPYRDALSNIKQEVAVEYHKIYGQAVLNLLGKAENPCRLIHEPGDEEALLPLHYSTNNGCTLHYFYANKLLLCYLFENYPEALKSAALAEKYLEAAPGLVVVAVFHFYDSLARLAVYPDSPDSEQKAILDKVIANQEKMQKWADCAPMNYLHKFYLIEAEKARILGQIVEAMELYERAIKAARNNRYIQDEALAYELGAKFYLARGMEEIAQTYMAKAHYCYSTWEATAKVNDIEAKYPQLLNSSATRPADKPPTIGNFITTSGSVEALDLATVMKASQAISGEIVLDKLLENLMKIIIENAGAQVGYLILETDGELLIEAAREVNSDRIAVLQSIPIDNRLSAAILNYVVRTKESVVLDDATSKGNFTNDPYIKQNQTKSILCLPLINQGQLVSIVYLENNLTVGAFTRDRLEVLKILSSQAAISIENARLYQTLEDKVKERTAQLAKANEEISTLNSLLQSENLRMSAELDILKQMQQMILPKPDELEGIENLDIAGFMEPADEVGGDYYDVLYTDGVVTIGIGDVTGHGLESGILMVMTQAIVRALKEIQEQDPVRFLATLNRTIYKNIERMNSIKNLTLAILNYADGRISISGQHEEVILVRKGGQIERIDTIDLGFPIGLDEEITDFISQTTVELAPGDGIVLYTDGITEAQNIHQKFYGIERLCEVVAQNWHLSAEEIKQAAIDYLRQFIGEQKVFDDITLVVLKQK